MSGLIGKKIGMTSLFDENGKNIPCTVLEMGPCVVTQVRTKEVDGYEALQLGFDDKPEKGVSMAAQGHFKKAGTPPKRKLVEFQNFEFGRHSAGLRHSVGRLVGCALCVENRPCGLLDQFGLHFFTLWVQVCCRHGLSHSSSMNRKILIHMVGRMVGHVGGRCRANMPQFCPCGPHHTSRS
mgnify:CR=1 FL=1